MYFPILTGVQYGRFNSQKMGDILLKNVFFCNLTSKRKVSWIVCLQLLGFYCHYSTQILCFSVFKSWHTYALSPPNRG